MKKTIVVCGAACLGAALFAAPPAGARHDAPRIMREPVVRSNMKVAPKHGVKVAPKHGVNVPPKHGMKPVPPRHPHPVAAKPVPPRKIHHAPPPPPRPWWKFW